MLSDKIKLFNKVIFIKFQLKAYTLITSPKLPLASIHSVTPFFFKEIISKTILP